MRVRLALPLALALASCLLRDAGALLVVLRAACPAAAADRAAFQRTVDDAASAGLRVLSYEETCGAEWTQRVARAALAALSAGVGVAAAGWPGAATCAALTAARRALGEAAGAGAVPAACGVGAARGAVSGRLAGLRPALAPAPARSECAAALEETERALAAAGSDVLRLAPGESVSEKVVIMCVSRERGVGPESLEAARGAARALLLHVDEPSPPLSPSPSPYNAVGDVLALAGAARPRGPTSVLSPEALLAPPPTPARALLDALASEAAPSEPALHLYERADADTDSRLVEVNLTEALARWEARESAGWARAAVLGMGAAAALALGGAALLGARWARRRGGAGSAGRGGARGAVLLAPGDLSFPADERRVGEGMETMLSCWLRRLHEFGAPAPVPRGAELLPEPAPAPRVPSLPSSTCSVNRVAVGAGDRCTRYKGEPVLVRYLRAGSALELKRKAVDVLLVMQSLRHENLNPFIGWVGARAALVWAHCWRGSLEDVLMADDIKLDWTFRLSLLTDLVKGMRYLHASPLRLHGRLSSRACLVDSRWVLRVSDYGLPALLRAQPPTSPPSPTAARDLLWTAPELLRDEAARARGSQAGDVFSFAIVMQEVIVRGEPFCMLPLTPEELVEKLRRPPPLIRPSVSMGAAPPEAVSVMRQCWSEAPELRPDFSRLHDTFRRLHRGRKVNIVDSMFEMLEKYSNNLEELIRERTEQLDMEKKKTEQLLNRMLPRSVAERLMLGLRVEPEEFDSVSIYFSDIVGFTALAARSSPVQVVDLLNDLYSTFDAAIERYRVYKVETIGDAYMVVGGLPTRASDHAEQVATMALHLLHLAGCFRVRHLPDTRLRLRVGLHSGPVCAAVVGLTMPRYCLFGDTVNTASRMESTGATWRVQVSAATAALLTAAGGYRLRSRGLVQIKGKGAMHTYWLLGKEGFDKSLPTPPTLASEEVLYETDGENDSEASSSPGPVPSPAVTVVEPLREVAEADLRPRDRGRRLSGAVSADSSPPGAGRYRRLGGAVAAGALRRQWSLERGDSLAEAVALQARAAP